ncbi:hypothetical protein FOL47_002927 [Perkinsus chesapeaki]|uniref:Protein LTV1 n=1 Tax=Perkinsus chesapeaki TaxID=330153 RepID=A0A7J6MB94_PERCH|nr:hypothetical protein FOL47_002927 [Perkinsus chesapeaki]
MVKGSQKRLFRNSNTVRYALVNKAFDGVNDTQEKVLMPYIPQNQLKKGAQLPEHDILESDTDSDYSDSGAAVVNPHGLDGDCYFPPDGYDYDQHLRKIDERNLFIDPNAEIEAEEDTPSDQEKEQKAELKKMSPEERAVFLAMDDAECVDDGSSDEIFFDSLLHGGDGRVDESRLLWGGPGVNETEEDRFDLMMGLQGGATTAQDDAFDRLLDEEYAEDEIGDLEDHFSRFDMPLDRATSVGGQSSMAFLKRDKQNLNINDCQDIIDDYIKTKEHSVLYKQYDDPTTTTTKDDREEALEVTREIIGRPEMPEKSVLVPVKERRASDEWDCESVLTTLTNNTNHPGKINRPARIRKPAMIPAPTLEAVREEDSDQETAQCEEEEELVEVSTYRPRDETPEERRARKAAVKQLQREARKAKKEIKATFKNEKLNCQRRGNTADIREGVSRVKL